jgi:hypothetical protein
MRTLKYYAIENRRHYIYTMIKFYNRLAKTKLEIFSLSVIILEIILHYSMNRLVLLFLPCLCSSKSKLYYKTTGLPQVLLAPS